MRGGRWKRHRRPQNYAFSLHSHHNRSSKLYWPEVVAVKVRSGRSSTKQKKLRKGQEKYMQRVAMMSRSSYWCSRRCNIYKPHQISKSATLINTSRTGYHLIIFREPSMPLCSPPPPPAFPHSNAPPNIEFRHIIKHFTHRISPNYLSRAIHAAVSPPPPLASNAPFFPITRTMA